MKLNYLIIPIISFSILYISKLIASTGFSWYRTITIPWFTPPDWIFSIVWNFLFSLGTVSVIIVWNIAPRNPLFWTIITLFCIQAILNITWSYLFFYKNNIGLALLDDIILMGITGAIIILIGRVSAYASLLLLPYLSWLSFATVLNYYLWILN